MFFHASQVANIKELMPQVSNHGETLVYLSKKRENTLVYLSNAIEKYCKETGYEHTGIWKKWASYGFTADGILRLEEYYPNATMDTYKGVSGYIYSTDQSMNFSEQKDIPDAVTTYDQVIVSACEFVPDAYEAIIKAVAEEKMILVRYEDNTPKMLAWIQDTMKLEYEQATENPEYRYFLKEKFAFI